MAFACCENVYSGYRVVESLIRVLPVHFPLGKHKALHSHIWLGKTRQKQAQNGSWYNFLAARSKLLLCFM